MPSISNERITVEFGIDTSEKIRALGLEVRTARMLNNGILIKGPPGSKFLQLVTRRKRR